jgi:hypothetical protein
VGFADEVARIRKGRDSKAALENLSPTEARTLAVSAIGDLQAAKRQGQTQRPASKVAAVEHVTAVVEQARIQKAAGKKPRPSVVAVYDQHKVLVGVVDPDALNTIPKGSATYDSTGAATGFVGVDGKLVLFADGGAAVKKAIDTMVGQATTVAKQLQAHRVANAPTQNPPLDAEAVIRALGTLAQRARVQKGLRKVDADSLAVGTLALAKLPPAERAVVRAKLARTTAASRRRLSTKLGGLLPRGELRITSLKR